MAAVTFKILDAFPFHVTFGPVCLHHKVNGSMESDIEQEKRAQGQETTGSGSILAGHQRRIMLGSQFSRRSREKGHRMFGSTGLFVGKPWLLADPTRQRIYFALFPLIAAMTIAASGEVTSPTAIIWWGERTHGTDIPSDLTNVVRIVCSVENCVAIRADGTAIGWGGQFTGQAEALAGVTDAKAVSLGYHHGLLLRSNGTVIAWGDGIAGENTVPPNLSNVVSVAAGGESSLVALA